MPLMKISKASGRKTSVSSELRTLCPGGGLPNKGDRDSHQEFRIVSLKETILQHSMTAFAFHL